MSDVIRDALIRIRYEVQKSKLEGPELSQTVKAHEKVAEAADKVAKTQLAIGSATERAAAAHEDFGRRSFTAFAHAGHGVLQLGRGLALLSASSEQDTQKILESLLKIEAGVSIAKGGANLIKFASEFGVLGIAVAGAGAAVAAGATIWSHFHDEVERSEAALKKVAEAHKVASEAERQLMHEREQNQIRGRASQSDAEADPVKRRAAQAEELAKLRAERAERAESAANTEKAIAKAEEAARSAEINAGKFTEGGGVSLDDVARGGGPRYGTTREGSLKEAERQKKVADDLRKQRESQVESDMAGAQREKDILDEQRNAQTEQIRKQEENRIAAMRKADENASPQDKARREMEDLRYNMQRQQFNATQPSFGGAMGFGLFGATGAAAMGTMGAATPQDIREAGTHAQANRDVDKVNEESTKAVKQVAAILTTLNDELAKLKVAHPN